MRKAQSEPHTSPHHTTARRASFPCILDRGAWTRVSALNVNMFSCSLEHMAPSTNMRTLHPWTQWENKAPDSPCLFKWIHFQCKQPREDCFLSFSVYIRNSICPWDSPYSSNSSIETGPSAHWVLLYGRHMTASVRNGGSLVRNKRLPAEGSSPLGSLIGRSRWDGGGSSPVCQSRGSAAWNMWDTSVEQGSRAATCCHDK